ncbi:VCBS repeat-containing protein [Candidatus Woesearchaeota archaeon]|nr:VCBS repeat-containing protein [Candidatus Woesearchaeota archaeon]
MSEAQKHLIAIAGTGLGLALGLHLGAYLREKNVTPASVYVQDLNEDGRPDVVVRNMRGDNFVYLQQENGSYQELERLSEQFRRTIGDKVKKIR